MRMLVPGAVGARYRAPDHARVEEMFVQMIHELGDPALERAAHADVVEDGLVLHGFAEAHAPGVRAHGHAELGRQKQYRDDFVDAAQPAGVDLAVGDRTGLEKLLCR